MKKFLFVLGLLALVSLALSACGGGASDAEDLLAAVKERGTLIVSTDPNYEPQSFLDAEAERKADTKCTADQLTYGEMIGFDVDVAKEVADRLGVEVCFVTPDWDVITAGNWSDRWDVSIGSMTVTTARQEVLDFVTPYYYAPAQFAAAADAGITEWADLDGQTVCVGTATTYEDWLNGVDLGLPQESFYMEPPSDVTIVTLPTDQECAQSIQAGREEFLVYLTSGTVVDSNISDGANVVKVGTAAYSENLSPAIDKGGSLDNASFVEAVDGIIQEMHADGTLKEISENWFDGVDLSADPTK